MDKALSIGLIVIIISIILLQILNIGLSGFGIYMEDRNNPDQISKQNSLHFATMTSSLTSGVLVGAISYLLMNKYITSIKTSSNKVNTGYNFNNPLSENNNTTFNPSGNTYRSYNDNTDFNLN